MSYQFYLNHFFDSIFNFSPKIQIQNTFIDNYYHVSHFIQRIRAVVHGFIRILNDSFSHLQHLGIKKDKLYFKLTFSLITLLKYKHQPCRTLRHMRRTHRAADSYHHIIPLKSPVFHRFFQSLIAVTPKDCNLYFVSAVVKHFSYIGHYCFLDLGYIPLNSWILCNRLFQYLIIGIFIERLCQIVL